MINANYSTAPDSKNPSLLVPLVRDQILTIAETYSEAWPQLWRTKSLKIDHEAPGSLIRWGPGSLTSMFSSKTRAPPKRFPLIFSSWKVLQHHLIPPCSFLQHVTFPFYCNAIHRMCVSDHKQACI